MEEEGNLCIKSSYESIAFIHLSISEVMVLIVILASPLVPTVGAKIVNDQRKVILLKKEKPETPTQPTEIFFHE